MHRELSTRLKCFCLDLLDLRASRWKPRREEAKLKTIDKFREDYRKEEQRKAMAAAAKKYGGGGGGGGGGYGRRNDRRNDRRGGRDKYATRTPNNNYASRHDRSSRGGDSRDNKAASGGRRSGRDRGPPTSLGPKTTFGASSAGGGGAEQPRRGDQWAQRYRDGGHDSAGRGDSGASRGGGGEERSTRGWGSRGSASRDRSSASNEEVGAGAGAAGAGAGAGSSSSSAAAHVPGRADDMPAKKLAKYAHNALVEYEQLGCDDTELTADFKEMGSKYPPALVKEVVRTMVEEPKPKLHAVLPALVASLVEKGVTQADIVRDAVLGWFDDEYADKLYDFPTMSTQLGAFAGQMVAKGVFALEALTARFPNPFVASGHAGDVVVAAVSAIASGSDVATAKKAVAGAKVAIVCGMLAPAKASTAVAKLGAGAAAFSDLAVISKMQALVPGSIDELLSFVTSAPSAVLSSKAFRAQVCGLFVSWLACAICPWSRVCCLLCVMCPPGLRCGVGCGCGASQAGQIIRRRRAALRHRACGPRPQVCCSW